ncbi:hypothetical protein F2P81_011205 [Scophthalmus maximus]|uniref:Uncharacterized protein n=1 Tax=Scophthalmus maximus TaxID=52904 RepID=A0A6A4SPJ9_SCOMX|nr:hypothetical protein F2P81_011205 [Scophthalmus maximus]
MFCPNDLNLMAQAVHTCKRDGKKMMINGEVAAVRFEKNQVSQEKGFGLDCSNLAVCSRSPEEQRFELLADSSGKLWTEEDKDIRADAYTLTSSLNLYTPVVEDVVLTQLSVWYLRHESASEAKAITNAMTKMPPSSFNVEKQAPVGKHNAAQKLPLKPTNKCGEFYAQEL